MCEQKMQLKETKNENAAKVAVFTISVFYASFCFPLMLLVSVSLFLPSEVLRHEERSSKMSTANWPVASLPSLATPTFISSVTNLTFPFTCVIRIHTLYKLGIVRKIFFLATCKSVPARKSNRSLFHFGFSSFAFCSSLVPVQ